MKEQDPNPSPAAPAIEPSPQAAQVPPGGGETAGSFVLAEIRSFLAGHLNRPLFRRFRELTGLPLHVLWHDPHEFRDPARLPVLCPAARTRLRASGTLPSDCALCQCDSWRPLDPTPDDGRLVHGACGAAGFWAGVRAGPLRPVTLSLHTSPPSPCFAQAVNLLQQVLHEAQAALAAALARRELNQALRRQSKPLAAPQPLPAIPPLPAAAPGHGVMRTMLEYVHAHYHCPLGLADLAAALNMNASYLSTLFSSTMGVTFHSYLGGLRLAKAKELLCDPAWHICEIADAAGYSSPSHFANAFKASVGLSPSAWRANAATGA